MTILVVEADKDPYTVTVWKQLAELRKIIGSERLEIEEHEGALIVFNEDAIKKLLPINRYIDDKAIRGVFILTGNNALQQDFDDLTEEQIEKYKNEFALQREEDMELE